MELAMYRYEQLYTKDDFQEDNMNYLSYDIVNNGLKDFQNYGKHRFSSLSDSVDSGRRSENELPRNQSDERGDEYCKVN